MVLTSINGTRSYTQTYFLFGSFFLFALMEQIAPKKITEYSVLSRWFTNFSITILNTLLLRILATPLPFLAVGAAIDANNWAGDFLTF